MNRYNIFIFILKSTNGLLQSKRMHETSYLNFCEQNKFSLYFIYDIVLVWFGVTF